MMAERGKNLFARIKAVSGFKPVISAIAIFLLVMGAACFQWRRALPLYFIGPDEWDFFSNFNQAQGFLGHLKLILTPQWYEFIPLFKIFFTMEYLLAGLHPLPYRLVTIGLLSLSSMLLYKFLLRELSGRAAAFAIAALYLTDSAYSQIVFFVYHQHFLLAFIFMQLALLAAGRDAELSGRLSLKAGLYCLLASLSMTAGLWSWPVTVLFFWLKNKIRETGRKQNVFAAYKYFIVPACIGVVAYAIFFYSRLNDLGSKMFTGPLVIAKGSLVLIASSFFKTVGLAYLTGPEYKPAFQRWAVPAFLAFAAVALFFFRKLDSKGKIVAITGAFLAALSGVMTDMAMAKPDLYFVSRLNRYDYFPSVGIFIVMAPFLALALKGRRPAHSAGNAALVSAVFALGLVHMGLIANYIGEYGGFVRTQSYYKSFRDSYNSESGFVPAENAYLVYSFKRKDDLVIPSNGGVLFLKNFEKIAPAGMRALAGSFSLDGGKVKLSGGGKAVSLFIKNPAPPAPVEYFYFRMKAAGAASGRLEFMSNNKASAAWFGISGGWRPYDVACPEGADMVLMLPPGDYLLKDFRIYE